jgi:uncharacterized membrane protein YeaQ/YmgE (transglycosylase-associated protein family)
MGLIVGLVAKLIMPGKDPGCFIVTIPLGIAGAFVGVFIDPLDKRLVAMGLFLLQGAAVLALAYSTHTVVLYLGTFIFGLTMGSILMTQSLLTAECLGMISFGTVSG